MKPALSILLVDDEPMIVASVARYLQLNDYQVITCNDGAQALALFKTRRFDISILDVDLPGLNGLSLLDQMLALHPECRFIVTSGAAETERPALPLPDAAPVTFIAKPFDLDELIHMIRHVPA